MKKTALILAFLMVFAVCLVACDETPADTSTPAAESSAPAEDSKVESTESSVPTDESSVPEVSDEASEEPSAPVELTGTNVASGKEVANAEDMCADITTTWVGADLTDGIAETTMENVTWKAGQWLGYWWNTESACNEHSNCVEGVAIPTVDLGEKVSINGARVNMYVGSGWNGVQPSASAELLVSDDGENWTSAGSVTVTVLEGENTVGWVVIGAAEGTEARYVRISMPLTGYWLFIDEIEVYS